MERKPKIKNWLKLIFLWIPIVLIFIWGYYHQFYKTYPVIPEPINDSVYMADTSIVTPEMLTVRVKSADVSQAKTFFSIITGENDVNETKKEGLEGEIKELEQKRKHLEENISKLKEQNDKLSQISYDMQQAIIKFVEKNRVRDMLASAFVGAFISVLLTFILSRPPIREKIDNWLWEKTMGESS